VSTFKAIVVTKTETGTAAALTEFDERGLMEGDVTLRPEWSTVNYKDGLAVTGKAPVVRRFPMIAGVDAAAVVEASSSPDLRARSGRSAGPQGSTPWALRRLPTSCR
jgi:acrylyl-CoA reductase (NADPH)